MSQISLYQPFRTGSLLGLALALASPAAAQSVDDFNPADFAEQPGADVAAVAAPEIVPADTVTSSGSAMADYQSTMDPTSRIDPRAKAAWLAECRRRANINPSATGKDRVTGAGTITLAETGARSYDYCEAYLDDYYRTYSPTGVGYSYGYQPQVLPQPAEIARPAVTETVEQPVIEEIIEEYVPVRTRNIARRAAPRKVHGKRVRVY